MKPYLLTLALFCAVAGCAANTPAPESAAYYREKWQACEARYTLLLEATKMYRDEVIRLEQDCR